MKAKVIILFWVLMFSAFAGIAFAGHETDYNTWYGLNAGHAVPTGRFNAFFGESAGYSATSGCCNAFLGRAAGYDTTTGESNVFVGNNAGELNVSGNNNTFVGREAGYSNTASGNTFLGFDSGFNNTTGTEQVFIGYEAGETNITAEGGTYVGYQAGKAATASYNTLIGSLAGITTTTGTGNTFVGRRSGEDNTEGNYNSALGYYAGQNNTTGSYNVFIGYNAGDTNTTGGQNTYIGGYSDGSATLTYATAVGYRSYVTQSNSLVLGSIAGVNGATASVNVGIGTSAPVRQLHLVGNNAAFRMDRDVDGASFFMVRTTSTGDVMKTFQVGTTASAVGTGEFIINDLGTEVSGYGVNRMKIANNGSVTFTGNVYANSFTPSSMTYKNNVRTYENALETVNKLRGVRFDWKDSGKPAVGLIAEEVEQVVPEVVARDGGNTTGINYASLVGVLVEAVKELKTENENLKKRLLVLEEK